MKRPDRGCICWSCNRNDGKSLVAFTLAQKVAFICLIFGNGYLELIRCVACNFLHWLRSDGIWRGVEIENFTRRTLLSERWRNSDDVNMSIAQQLCSKTRRLVKWTTKSLRNVDGVPSTPFSRTCLMSTGFIYLKESGKSFQFNGMIIGPNLGFDCYIVIEVRPKLDQINAYWALKFNH